MTTATIKQTDMKTTKPTLNNLRAKAEAMGYTVEDDREFTTLYIHAPEGKAWEGGNLTSLVHPYGQHQVYLPDWRNSAINDAFERLDAYPPSLLVDSLYE